MQNREARQESWLVCSPLLLPLLSPLKTHSSVQLLAHCRGMIHEYGSIFYDSRGLEIVGLVEEEPLFERNFCSKLFLFVRRGNEIFIPKLWSISGEGTRCSVVRKNRLVVYARSIVASTRGGGGGLISLPKFWQNRYLTRWRITRNDLYNEGIYRREEGRYIYICIGGA